MIAGIAFLWRLPSLVLVPARWQGGRLRFGAVMGLGRALVALVWPGVAARVYGAEAKRAERGMRAIWAGRVW